MKKRNLCFQARTPAILGSLKCPPGLLEKRSPCPATATRLSGIRSVLRILLCVVFTTLAPAITPAAPAKETFKRIELLTCADIGNDDTMMTMAIWLDGYRAGTLRQTMLDRHWMDSLPRALTRHCEADPSGPLLPVIDEMIRRY